MGADYPVGNCRNRPLGHRSLLRHFSGFVIYYKNFPEALPARTFILRWALRIVPLYWLFTVLAFVLR